MRAWKRLSILWMMMISGASIAVGVDLPYMTRKMTEAAYLKLTLDVSGDHETIK